MPGPQHTLPRHDLHRPALNIDGAAAVMVLKGDKGPKGDPGPKGEPGEPGTPGPLTAAPVPVRTELKRDAVWGRIEGAVDYYADGRTRYRKIERNSLGQPDAVVTVKESEDR